MPKRVNFREFFQNFAKLHAAMKPGATLIITKHGKPLGEFRKRPRKRSARRLFRMPDFQKLGLEPKGSQAARDALYEKLMGSFGC